MKKLIQMLQEFQYAQIDKFVKRIFKHPDNSVTDDKQFYNSIRENEKAVEEHLVEEFCEYFNLNEEQYNEICRMINDRELMLDRQFRLANNKEELVDIANLAFLIWCISE